MLPAPSDILKLPYLRLRSARKYEQYKLSGDPLAGALNLAEPGASRKLYEKWRQKNLKRSQKAEQVAGAPSRDDRHLSASQDGFHSPRTLDQFYYTLTDDQVATRALDQVVYRFTKSRAHFEGVFSGTAGLILMVDQLWLWCIDEPSKSLRRPL